MKYRKKPVVIEAVQIPQPNDHLSPAFESFLNDIPSYKWHGMGGITIRTPEGTMTASPGDWIIRGVRGEFYPCKPDIFEATYEAVEA